MSDIWENVWEDVSEAYQRLSTSLIVSHAGMKWSCGHSDNNAFPFRAYASFNRGADGSMDVIASVDFQRSSPEKLRYSADIGLDDGQVLTDGPSGNISVASGIAAAAPEITTAVQEITAFLAANSQIIAQAMESE
jgi:hypothetical protein